MDLISLEVRIVRIKAADDAILAKIDWSACMNIGRCDQTMETQWLIIELEKTPKVQLVQCTRENLLNGYVPTTGFSGSTGHYDWLRSSSNEILGVRYWPFDDDIHAAEVSKLQALCRSLDYAYIDCEDRFISIIFSGLISDVVEDISNDQDLGENGIYVNQQGGMAICFEMDSRFLAQLL